MKSTPDNEARRKMVRGQIVARGISDSRVISAMEKVPRELFVDQFDYEYAFHDGPLSIGHGQTISQPYIVAYMSEKLQIKVSDRILEIGTGSGYQTAVLAELAAEVYTVEIIAELSERARAVLSRFDYDNIHFRAGNGFVGWEEEAPFDAIIVTAAPEHVPGKLLSQLAQGGRMIVPVGLSVQHLRLYRRTGDKISDEELIGVRFVPMTGRTEDDEE